MARVYKLKTEIIGKGRDSILMVLESIAREIRNNEKAGLIGSTGTRARGTFTLELLPGGVEPEDAKAEAAAKKRPAPPPKREPAAVE